MNLETVHAMCEIVKAAGEYRIQLGNDGPAAQTATHGLVLCKRVQL